MAAPTVLVRGIAATPTTSRIMRKPINSKILSHQILGSSITRKFQIKSFSTQHSLSSQQQPNSSHKSTNTGANQSQDGNQGQQDTQQPKINLLTVLDQLGATRRTKIVVLVALSIFGTMETIFYVKWFYRWLYPPPEDERKPKVYN